jgi:hypothetical protein
MSTAGEIAAFGQDGQGVRSAACHTAGLRIGQVILQETLAKYWMGIDGELHRSLVEVAIRRASLV